MRQLAPTVATAANLASGSTAAALGPTSAIAASAALETDDARNTGSREVAGPSSEPWMACGAGSDVQWLVATAWNRGAHHARYHRYGSQGIWQGGVVVCGREALCFVCLCVCGDGGGGMGDGVVCSILQPLLVSYL
jgi:hypothetical protein